MPPWAHKESLPDEKSGRLSYFVYSGLVTAHKELFRLIILY